MKSFFRFICFFLIVTASLTTVAGKDFAGKSPYEVGEEGEAFYKKGKYQEAAQHILYALENGEHSFALTYADICKRELDGKKHKMSEAARWYIVAADAGDGDAYSYLHAIDPHLIDGETLIAEKVRVLKELWRVEERLQNADEGYKLHRAGDVHKAARYLKRASQGNHPLAQDLYADICLRRLDGKFHLEKEAAMWFLLSARGGNPQAMSYLHTVYPGFESEQDNEKIMLTLSGSWVREVTLERFTSTLPGKINAYLMHKHGMQINKVCSQKHPYFFDKFLSALFRTFGEQPQPTVEEAPLAVSGAMGREEDHPAKMRRLCGEEERTTPSVVRTSNAPWVYGVVYPSYFKSLELNEHGFLKSPDQPPKLEILIEVLLDIYHRHVREKTAKEMSRMSHLEYPWIEAGIKYWKQRHGQTFNKTSLSEVDLLDRLRKFQPIDPHDIEKTLDFIDQDKQIDNKHIWPNEGSGDSEISSTFSKRIRFFFGSDISVNDPFVQVMIEDFFRSVQKQEVSIKNPKDKEILRTPLLMHLCEEIEIKDVSKHKSCSDILEKAARYFSNMKKITVYTVGSIPQSSEIALLLRKLAKRGISVEIR